MTAKHELVYSCSPVTVIRCAGVASYSSVSVTMGSSSALGSSYAPSPITQSRFRVHAAIDLDAVLAISGAPNSFP
jgi:hypothetical protein